MIQLAERGLDTGVSQEHNPQQIRTECVNRIESTLRRIGSLSKEHIKPSDISAPPITYSNSLKAFANLNCPVLTETGLIIMHQPAKKSNKDGQSVCLTTRILATKDSPTRVRVDTQGFLTKRYNLTLPPLEANLLAWEFRVNKADESGDFEGDMDNNAPLGKKDGREQVLLIVIKPKGKHLLTSVLMPKNWREAFNKNGQLIPLEPKKVEAPAVPASAAIIHTETPTPTTVFSATSPTEREKPKLISTFTQLLATLEQCSRETAKNRNRRAVLEGPNTNVSTSKDPKNPGMICTFHGLSRNDALQLIRNTYPDINDLIHCFSKTTNVNDSLVIKFTKDPRADNFGVTFAIRSPRKANSIRAKNSRQIVGKISLILERQVLSDFLSHLKPPSGGKN
ncbi:MAG: hypothetical protein ABH816_04155 [Candidatus Levyibacteriota bacterium]